MKMDLLKIATSFISIFFICNTSLANTISREIKGNPIGKRDNYTINSDQQKTTTVNCQFTNSGNTKALINIYTSPKQTKPFATIKLAKSSKATKSFSLPLEKKWWCRIYTPHGKKAKAYCAYFSISDATVVKYNPFATWDSTTRSTDTSYQCSLSKKQSAIDFYYFK